MKNLTPIAALLLASAAAAQTAYELPRPTSLTVTNGLVECADAAGCLVQRACGVPTAPFADSDFAQVAGPLAEGETLETPRRNSRAARIGRNISGDHQPVVEAGAREAARSERKRFGTYGLICIVGQELHPIDDRFMLKHIVPNKQRRRLGNRIRHHVQ